MLLPFSWLVLHSSLGIFPREPRSRKKANKGSSAPTSFYYTKDIAYLAHEPVLRKLREHKAFAKKLARALGRGEWSSAKSLEDNKPVYRLDHIIKERYVFICHVIRCKCQRHFLPDIRPSLMLFATSMMPSVSFSCSHLCLPTIAYQSLWLRTVPAYLRNGSCMSCTNVHCERSFCPSRVYTSKPKLWTKLSPG